MTDFDPRDYPSYGMCEACEYNPCSINYVNGQWVCGNCYDDQIPPMTDAEIRQFLGLIEEDAA